MNMEHLKFIDSMFPTLSITKIIRCLQTHRLEIMVSTLFQHEGILDYVGQFPNLKYYGVEEMGVSERAEFIAWYEEKCPGLWYSITDRRCNHIFKRTFLS
jgi:hypothetical protein